MTSTKPSVICADFFTHQGKVPVPDCFKTFGLLGAEVRFDFPYRRALAGDTAYPITRKRAGGRRVEVFNAANATVAVSIIAIDRAA